MPPHQARHKRTVSEKVISFAPGSISGLAASIGRAALDWALPHRCAGCGALTGGDAGFCPDCWQQLDFLGPPACARCDRPFAQPQGEGALCGACMADPPPFDRVRGVLAYGPLPRALVVRFKHGRHVALARLIARLMASRLPPPDERGDERWLLIPVPLHRWRLWRRGFNQAAIIARHLAAMTQLPVLVDALERRRATPLLRGLGRRQRAKVVRGAFAVRADRRDAIAGAHILLIDDVFTTGATARACAAALRRAGAARVEVLVLARVLDDADRAAIDTMPLAANMPQHGRD